MQAEAEPLSELDVLKLLEAGLEKTTDEQNRWLRDLDLTREDRLRLTQLLASTQSAAERFETGTVAQWLFTPPVNSGDEIGAYQLDELLGCGGMGLVFRAHRTAGDFDQTVAIKFVNIGPNDATIKDLFDNERRILASLSHPNIATLYDGGVHRGVPYVVMEYVDGVCVTDFVTQSDAGLNTLLQLFIKVCNGVQFAHQSLIIHRDLKPSNILVTTSGQPKIVDFGIAQREQPDGPAGPVNGMTTSYASPEQQQSLPLTSASDVYSLGVVLFELLTGLRFNPDQHGVDACLESLTPSLDLPTRHALNAVLRKALATDAQHRYATAGELSADLTRLLNHQVVSAHVPARIYPAAAFVWRHSTGVAMSVIAIGCLVAGLAATYWQYTVANTERGRSAQFSGVLEDIILSPSKWSALTQGNTLLLDRDSAVTDLWHALERYVEEQSVADEVRVRTLGKLAESYLNLDEWEDSLRTSAKALQYAEDARLPPVDVLPIRITQVFAMHKSGHAGTLPAYKQLLEALPHEPRLRREYGGVLQNYGIWLWALGELEQARTTLSQAKDIIDSTGTSLEQAYNLGNLGLLNCLLGHLQQCLTQLDQAIELWAQAGQPALASFHRAKARALFWVGELDQAATQAQLSIDAGAATTPGTLEHLRAYVGAADIELAMNNLTKARSHLQTARSMAQKLLPEDHAEHNVLAISEAELLLQQGNISEAMRMLERVVSTRDKDAPYTLLSTRLDFVYGKALLAQARIDEAQVVLQRSAQKRREILGPQAAATRAVQSLLD